MSKQYFDFSAKQIDPHLAVLMALLGAAQSPLTRLEEAARTWWQKSVAHVEMVTCINPLGFVSLNPWL